MKIAVFHNLSSGGAKRSLHGFVKHLAAQKHQIELFIPSTADESFLNLRHLVCQTTVIPVQRTVAGTLRSTRYLLPIRFSPADLRRAQERLANTINSKDFDVVLVEQDRFTMSPFLLKFLSRPHVYYCQQPSRLGETIREKLYFPDHLRMTAQQRLRHRWHKYLAKKIPQMDQENASSAKYIITNSDFTRQAIQKLYNRNASVSYLGVDTDIFRHTGPPRGDYVLSVGSFEPLKGYEFLVRVLARLPQAQRPPLIIIANAGDPSYVNAVKRLAEQNKVRLELHSMVDDNQLVRYYNEARLFLYAPYLEPFGLAVLEAMACGTPVVTVKEGGIRESVVENQTGLLADRDEEEFSNAVLKLLQDPTLAETLAKNAQEAISNFWTFRHATQRLLDHLMAATNGIVIS